MHIFISHSSEDSELAKKLCGMLEAEGHKCFIAPRDIRSGYEYAEEIVNGIDDSDMVLLLLSEKANGSPHVLREVERAVSKNKSIIVYKLEEVKLSKSLEYFLMTHQWLDLEPGRDHSSVVRAINNYAAAHNGGSVPRPETTSSTSAASAPSGKGSLKRIIIPAAAVTAVAVVSAAVVIAVNCFSGGIRTEESSMQSALESAPQVTSVEPQQEDAVSSAANAETTVASSAGTVVSEDTDTVSQGGIEIAEQPAENTRAESEPVQTGSEPQTSAVSESAPQEIPLSAGSSVMLGSYNGDPVEWRIIHISDDGKTAVAITDKIITMKAFDAAEGGSYNSDGGEDYWRTPTEDISEEIQRKIRGDNRWELSNIRTWLNSGREMVKYDDQPPIAKAMSEHDNGYSTEPGFLKGFTADELSVIAETQVDTNGTVTSDRVFLLSSGELEWLYDSDVSVYAEPTPGALEQDTSGWYGIYLDGYGTKDFFWWLRDADSTCACRSHIVNISCMDNIVDTQYVGLEGYGIRPAVTIDLTAENLPLILERTNEIS